MGEQVDAARGSLAPWVKGLAKFAVSAALMVVLLRRIPSADLLGLVAGMDRRLLAVAAGCFFCSNVLASVQWYRLLVAAGIEISWPRAFRFYFVGLFFNNFLPANIGGDAVKVYDITRTGGRVYNAIAATVLDRVIGIVAMCVLATAATAAVVSGMVLSGGAGTPWSAYLILFAVCVGGAVALFSFRAPGRLLRVVAGRIGVFGIGSKMIRVLDDLHAYRNRKRLVGGLVGLSLAIQCMRVATHILVGTALGISFSHGLFVQFYVFVPLLSLAMIPPVTINGLGIREGLGVVLLGRVGIGRADAFAVEFLTYVISVAVSLLGLVFFLIRRHHRNRGGVV